MQKYIIIIFLSTFAYAEDWINNTYKKYSNTIVRIEGYKDGELQTTGNGFIINNNGSIVTNYHVISGAETITITTISNKNIQVTGYYVVNQLKDYAILETTGFGMPSVKLGDSRKVEIGDDILAIGLGSSYTLTNGIISKIHQYENTEYIQISSPIQPSNSGGPLFNNKGEVIGITRGSIEDTCINFAVPIHYILDELNNFTSTLKPLIDANKQSTNPTKQNKKNTRKKKEKSAANEYTTKNWKIILEPGLGMDYKYWYYNFDGYEEPLECMTEDIIINHSYYYEDINFLFDKNTANLVVQRDFPINDKLSGFVKFSPAYLKILDFEPRTNTNRIKDRNALHWIDVRVHIIDGVSDYLNLHPSYFDWVTLPLAPMGHVLHGGGFQYKNNNHTLLLTVGLGHIDLYEEVPITRANGYYAIDIEEYTIDELVQLKKLHSLTTNIEYNYGINFGRSHRASIIFGISIGYFTNVQFKLNLDPDEDYDLDNSEYAEWNYWKLEFNYEKTYSVFPLIKFQYTF